MTRWKRPGSGTEWTRELAGGRLLLSVSWVQDDRRFWGRSHRAFTFGPVRLAALSRPLAQLELTRLVREEMQSVLSKIPEDE